MGQIGWITVFWKIAVPSRLLKAATQSDFGLVPSCGHFLPHGRVSTRQRALDEEAPCRSLGIPRHPDCAEKYLFDYIPRLRRRQSLAKPGHRTVHVSIESFAKEP